MTRAEALVQAMSRWGPHAVVGKVPPGVPAQRVGRYYVRSVPWVDAFAVQGAGESWEAAFADADRSAERKGVGE